MTAALPSEARLYPGYWGNLIPIPNLDSNLRFLGGLGIGLGAALLWLTPSIEKHTLLFRAIWLCALAGGVGRMVSGAVMGTPFMALLVFTFIEVPGVPLPMFRQKTVASAGS